MLLLRVSFGMILMVKAGFSKVMDFSHLQHTFYNFMGLGAKVSLILVLFGEIFCSLLIVLGLFTRYACIPIIFIMLVIIYGSDAGKDLLESDRALLYLIGFTTVLLVGPGKVSVDGMINK